MYCTSAVHGRIDLILSDLKDLYNSPKGDLKYRARAVLVSSALRETPKLPGGAGRIPRTHCEWSIHKTILL